MTKKLETICSHDIEAIGKNPLVNPNIQIGVGVLSLMQSEKGKLYIKLESALNLCIKEDHDEEKLEEIISEITTVISNKVFDKSPKGITKNGLKKFSSNKIREKVKAIRELRFEKMEKRCWDQFWSQEGRENLLEAIRKNAISKKKAYSLYVEFKLKNRRLFPNIKDVTDNGNYDLPRISLALQRCGFNPLEFIDGGKYCGYGLDSNDFVKGACCNMGITKKDFYKKLGIENKVESFVTKNKAKLESFKVPLIKHSAIYDAIEIGITYLISLAFIKFKKEINI